MTAADSAVAAAAAAAAADDSLSGDRDSGSTETNAMSNDELCSEDVSDEVYAVLLELVTAGVGPYLLEFVRREEAPRDRLIIRRLAEEPEQLKLNLGDKVLDEVTQWQPAVEALQSMERATSYRGILSALFRCKVQHFGYR
jgi:hypothetical protein